MAEGLLGGILSDDEKPEVEAPEALASAEAFAAAVAARLSGGDPEVARDTSAFLKKQTQLLDTQNKHLEDEHALRVAHLRNQLSDEGLRGFGLRLRLGFQLFLVLVATVIGVGAALMLRDAISSRSIVVDAFDVSPVLATQALSGRIAAADFHDQLTQLQAATRTSAQKREITSAWGNDIAIDLPDTGISIGQLERMLKTHFGHDQHITGSLVQSGTAGLELTVRGAGVLPRIFADEQGNLHALMVRAAEYVYGEAQPGLFSHYLSNDTGRYEEAIAFVKAHLATASVDDQAMMLNYWGNSLSGLAGPDANRQALRLHREAVRIKPDYWIAIANVGVDLESIGEEEDAMQLLLQMSKTAGGRPNRPAEDDYSGYDLAVYNLQAVRASALSGIAQTGGVSNVGYAEPMLAIAPTDVLLHEPDTARLRLTVAAWNPKSHVNLAGVFYTEALLAEESGDLTAAAASWDLYAAQYADRVVSTNSPYIMCWAAPSYEKTGQPAKADAALAAPLKAVGISTFVDCYRFRADVLELRGDWAQAQQWYAKAVKLNPSSPAGYYSWGLALLKHGDLPAAVEQFRLANQKGPHWADPLKAWGDVLMKQNNAKDALAKYDEALKCAPNWKQLKEAREAAAKLKT